MKTTWLSLALVILSGHSWAQAGELHNAEVTLNTALIHPVKIWKARTKATVQDMTRR